MDGSLCTANTGKSFVKNFSSTLGKFSWCHLPLCCLWILQHCNTNSTAGLWFSCSQTQTNSGQEGNLVMIILIMYLQIRFLQYLMSPQMTSWEIILGYFVDLVLAYLRSGSIYFPWQILIHKLLTDTLLNLRKARKLFKVPLWFSTVSLSFRSHSSFNASRSFF